MQQASKNWKLLRLATLERTRRTTIEPLAPLYTIYSGICVLYLAGFLGFQFIEQGTEFTLMLAVLVMLVAIAGALVPVLTGSVLTLYFVSRKLERLVDE